MNHVKELIFPPSPGECHASTIVELPGGGFLAAWFAGSREGQPDVRIRWSRRTPSGSWAPPEVLPAVTAEAHWNPVLFLRPDGVIALCFKVGGTIADWRTYQCRWLPEHATWSNAEELVPGDLSGGRGPVKNKPLLTSDGTLLAPASVERDSWTAFVDRSRDGGNHWEKSGRVPLPDLPLADPHSGNRLGVIQPTLWESKPGNIHMLLRSNHGRLYRSDSVDNGKTWSPARATAQANNNSGIDLAKLIDGSLLLAANVAGENWGVRNRLGIWRSFDNGQSWQLVDQPAGCPETEQPDGRKSEFSYPALIALADGGAALTFTRHRQTISFVRYPPFSLKADERKAGE